MTAAKQQLKHREAEVRNGFRVKGDPNVIDAELEKIRAKSVSGDAEAEDIVKIASNPKNPLHEEFVWDDSVAGHQFRLQQARYLVRAIEVIYETVPMGRAQKVKLVRVPAYSNLRPKGPSEGRGYTRTVEIVDDPQLRQQLLAEAYRDIERFKLKYAILEEFGDLMDAMNRTLNRLKKKVKGQKKRKQ